MSPPLPLGTDAAFTGGQRYCRRSACRRWRRGKTSEVGSAADPAVIIGASADGRRRRQPSPEKKNSVALSRRLLNKELDPVVIVNMSHNELKDGLTAEEKKTKEPEESKRVQMTDARCSRCTEKKVCVAEIIHANHGDRYQLECMVCGYTWYASHNAISSLTIDTPSVAGNVGTAPWATAKFEDVERKKLVSPRDSKKPNVDSSIHTGVRGAEII